jgi:putative two-component system response regulator
MMHKSMSRIRVKPRVMVVDDAPENLIVLNSILVNDYTLKFVNDSSRVVDEAASNPPDLILLDIMMPGIDGLEVCRRLKATNALAEIPVLFLTGKNHVEDEEAGFAAGASDFIHKPISAPIVRARVKTHIKIKKMMDVLKLEIDHLHEDAEQSTAELGLLKEYVWGHSPAVG